MVFGALVDWIKKLYVRLHDGRLGYFLLREFGGQKINKLNRLACEKLPHPSSKFAFEYCIKMMWPIPSDRT